MQLLLSDKIYIAIISIILPISYIYFINRYRKISTNKLWGRITGNFKLLNTISLFIIAIAYLITYFAIINYSKLKQEERVLILVGYTGFILFSFLWEPLSFIYLSGNKSVKYSIILSLGLVSLFALLLFLVIRKLDMNIISKVAAFYIFFHTFVFDFIIWNYNFF